MLHLLHHLVHMQLRHIKEEYGLEREKCPTLSVLGRWKWTKFTSSKPDRKHSASSCSNEVHFIITHTDWHNIQQLPLCAPYEVQYMSPRTSQQLVAVNDVLLVTPSTNSFINQWKHCERRHMSVLINRQASKVARLPHGGMTFLHVPDVFKHWLYSNTRTSAQTHMLYKTHYTH